MQLSAVDTAEAASKEALDEETAAAIVAGEAMTVLATLVEVSAGEREVTGDE